MGDIRIDLCVGNHAVGADNEERRDRQTRTSIAVNLRQIYPDPSIGLLEIIRRGPAQTEPGDDVTTGAAGDISQASVTARRMVTVWGMSDKLGRIRYSDNEEEVFLGHSVAQRKNVSDATAKLIDEEIRRIIEQGETTARQVLSEHIDELHALAKGLLEYETLSGDECRKIIAGEEIIRDTGDDSPRPVPRRSSIPPTGGVRKEKPSGGLEPEPQPNA